MNQKNSFSKRHIGLTDQNIEKILNYLGYQDLDELIEYVDDRPGHDFRYELDSSKARKELNWVPRFQFKEALDKTVDWYIKQITN